MAVYNQPLLGACGMKSWMNAVRTEIFFPFVCAPIRHLPNIYIDMLRRNLLLDTPGHDAPCWLALGRPEEHCVEFVGGLAAVDCASRLLDGRPGAGGQKQWGPVERHRVCA
jgi:hypothetical protein